MPLAKHLALFCVQVCVLVCPVLLNCYTSNTIRLYADFCLSPLNWVLLHLKTLCKVDVLQRLEICVFPVVLSTGSLPITMQRKYIHCLVQDVT